MEIIKRLINCFTEKNVRHQIMHHAEAFTAQRIAEAEQFESRQILGVHVIGHQAAEIVNFVSVAIRSELTLEELFQVPPVHPSTAEAIQECAKGLGSVAVG